MRSKRDAVIKVLVSDEEHARFSDLAELSGMSLSTWMRAAATAIVNAKDPPSLRVQQLHERIITSLLAQHALGDATAADVPWEKLHNDMWRAVEELVALNAASDGGKRPVWSSNPALVDPNAPSQKRRD